MNRSVAYALISAAIALAGCSQPTSPAGRGKPPVPSKPEPPSLWSVQTQDDQGKVTKTALICADSAVRRSFARPLPSPNGKPCQLLAAPVDQGDRFAARCKTDGGHFDIQAARTGDPEKDLTVKLLIQTDVKGHEALSQTLRYRRLGDCPADWAAGDTAAPGALTATNSLSGAGHPLSSPAPSPAPAP
ncbi:MAG: hypothetical protein P4L73_03940 [Caulobacteraceae bacterium]|nr:hypothetical protein [Caulobacteraceae bacterium]